MLHACGNTLRLFLQLPRRLQARLHLPIIRERVKKSKRLHYVLRVRWNRSVAQFRETWQPFTGPKVTTTITCSIFLYCCAALSKERARKQRCFKAKKMRRRKLTVAWQLTVKVKLRQLPQLTTQLTLTLMLSTVTAAAVVAVVAVVGDIGAVAIFAAVICIFNLFKVSVE